MTYFIEVFSEFQNLEFQKNFLVLKDFRFVKKLQKVDLEILDFLLQDRTTKCTLCRCLLILRSS